MKPKCPAIKEKCFADYLLFVYLQLNKKFKKSKSDDSIIFAKCSGQEQWYVLKNMLR